MRDVENVTAVSSASGAAETPLRSILVGIDGSSGSARAVAWAAHMAQACDSRVTVVHVLTPNEELVRDFSFETMRLWRRDLESELRGAWVEPLRACGVNHRCILLEADTVTSGLAQTAVNIDADLVVVSTRGRGRSTSRHLLAQGSQRPVVMVPETWAAPTR